MKLENVNLKNVIRYGLTNDFLPLFLSDSNLERLFLGREPSDFRFDFEFACYFRGLSGITTIFIYDTLDYSDGLNCTCPIYWVYRFFDFENKDLMHDIFNDYKYVPKCIKSLNKSELNDRVSDCFGSHEPSIESCKITQNTPDLYDSTSVFSSTVKTTKREYLTTIMNLDQQFNIMGQLNTLTVLLIVLISLLSVLILILIAFKVANLKLAIKNSIKPIESIVLN